MEQLNTMQHNDIIGSYKRFGDDGVVYEVLDFIDDNNIKILVLETGEETSYPLQDAKNDPTEG
jgi:hypothetical protein